MKLLIAVYHPFGLWQAPEWFEQRLTRDFPELKIVWLPNYERVTEEIGDTDIFLGWSLRPEQFAKAKKLRWIHSTAAAVHQLMSPELAASDVLLTNAREVHGQVVAEHAIAVIFALAKRLPAAGRYQEQRRWAQTEMWKRGVREVAGSTLGLIGMGAIGRETAKRARAVGMRVVAVREHPEKGSDAAEQVVGFQDLDSILQQSDFVVLAAPLTAKTQHLMNRARLARMKPTAFLINVSRGPLIDDPALVSALQQKQIAGAALDVFAEEPLPADSPYWALENCLITPHTAAVTDQLWERHYGLFTENLRRFLAGEPLKGIVNKRLGY